MAYITHKIYRHLSTAGISLDPVLEKYIWYASRCYYDNPSKSSQHWSQYIECSVKKIGQQIYPVRFVFYIDIATLSHVKPYLRALIKSTPLLNEHILSILTLIEALENSKSRNKLCFGIEQKSADYVYKIYLYLPKIIHGELLQALQLFTPGAAYQNNTYQAIGIVFGKATLAKYYQVFRAFKNLPKKLRSRLSIQGAKILSQAKYIELIDQGARGCYVHINPRSVRQFLLTFNHPALCNTYYQYVHYPGNCYFSFWLNDLCNNNIIHDFTIYY